MKIIAKEKQADYFDDVSHQYNIDIIDQPPAHTQYEQASLIKAMQLADDKHENILDFGSGSGRITFSLIAEGYHVFAMDPSEQSLQNLSKLASKKHISLEKYTLTTNIPNDQFFDRVVGADILHHVELDKELPILHEVLAEKGRIAFSEPGAMNVAWYFFLLINYSWNIERGILQMTIPTLTRSLKAAGFKDISIEGLGLVPMPMLNIFPTLHRLNRLLAKLPILRYFSFRYIITARK